MGQCSGFVNYDTYLCCCGKTGRRHSNKLVTQTQSSAAENVSASLEFEDIINRTTV